MRKTIIAGNWKMNNTRQQSKELVQGLLAGIKGQAHLPEIVLCPPFTSLETVLTLTAGTPIQVGAQNMEAHESGAYTGEIAPGMLADLGVKWVLIGHSERRQYYNETDKGVNAKLKAALKHHLLPIVCVGETLEQREANHTDSVVSRQVSGALEELDAQQLKELVIAYEPVWAIGTGKVCDAKEAARVIKVIRQTLNSLQSGLGERVPVLYGGSVNAKNVDEQLALPDIDGSLVGGASLKPDEFLAIIKAGEKRLAVGAAK